MKAAANTYQEARTLFERLPESSVSAATRKAYLKTLKRMLAEGEVDPLRTGDARDTYNYRRAALHGGTKIVLKSLLDVFDDAALKGDRSAAERAIDSLAEIIARCGPAIERDPPLDRDGSSFDCGPSRWTLSDGPHPRRGRASKKHELKKLPLDWTDRIWAMATETNWRYLDALAAHMLSSVRPAEFVPGVREGKQVGGVVIMLDGSMLTIHVSPAKSHGGKYGTGETKILIDAKSDHPAVIHLVVLCRSNGGSATVSLPNTNGMRKAFEKLGRKALPCVDVIVTGYLFRHQYIADLKSTVGAGSEVAAAAGHCTDRTQSRYGRVEHGRRRNEFIAAKAKREPVCGNVERGRMISASRGGSALAPTGGP